MDINTHSVIAMEDESIGIAVRNERKQYPWDQKKRTFETHPKESAPAVSGVGHKDSANQCENSPKHGRKNDTVNAKVQKVHEDPDGSHDDRLTPHDMTLRSVSRVLVVSPANRRLLPRAEVRQKKTKTKATADPSLRSG